MILNNAIGARLNPWLKQDALFLGTLRRAASGPGHQACRQYSPRVCNRTCILSNVLPGIHDAESKVGPFPLSHALAVARQLF